MKSEYDELVNGRKYRVSLDTPVGSIEFDGVLMSEAGYGYRLVAIGEVEVNTGGLHGVVFEEVVTRKEFAE